MTIYVSYWTSIIAAIVACYALNYLLMCLELVFYNNDPEHEWTDMDCRVKQGPSAAGRIFLLLVSPITIMFMVLYVFIVIPSKWLGEGLIWIAKSTYKKR